MFQIARSNTAKFAVFQARCFTGAQLLSSQAAVASRKPVSPELKDLRAQLKLEKLVLNEMKIELRKILDNEKKKKKIALEKKREARALRPYKHITPLNLFVKENIKSIGALAETSQAWVKLSDAEKESYVEKAKKFNEDQLKIYTPKPVGPVPAYAKFLKSVWTAGADFGEASKAASLEWKKLTPEEKMTFSPSDKERAAYKLAYAAWKEERLRLANSKA
ncbi:hypothetical protein METBIDRAFT_9916 [Metschnikowia bicuspidata var. bicuspidata NRRL YB-4993]|uniref:HMG box domain-containing protein n=1 Tax=Metschnikowia bicuspidata var. bicuspidata NRRL YB-4993 TaxID=869754 RepID=A0A1A0HHN0_9ASCO|nr:hypothetical protein METBIDRAFT_9916 [Metschnikowia bicuspidata var. bicuspidata NRRL YB-4993]OBA23669.1 hypothetical protein METBIDRAFT_9916 [Metschnikowia bicuspidata var. bicuspidata NRRL YB-4993]